MERKRDLVIRFTEEEAYELLMRCVSHDEEDNASFRSAMSKLAQSIKGELRLAA